MTLLKRSHAVVVLVAVLVCVPSHVHAAARWWDAISPTTSPADGGNGTWTDTASLSNWRTADTGGVQASYSGAQQATFPVIAGTGTYTVTVSGTVQISGASASYGSAGIAAASGAGNVAYEFEGTGVSPTIQLGGAAFIHANTGTAFSSNLTINTNGQALTFSNGGAISSLISGAGTVTKGGGGGLTLSNDSNSYTGATTLNQGTLSFSSIRNVGSGVSALGAPTTVANGTIGLGSGVLTGAMRYTGTTDASSNRTVNLAGTTGDVSIEVFSTGNLTLASAFTATGAGNKTLTLTGSSSGIGTIQGAIPNFNSGNLTSLAKTGSGKWVLSGTNAFTGTTTISGGTLQVGGAGRLGNAATYAGAITLSNNALLQFSTSTGQNFSGAITGTGNITKDTSNNDLTLSNTGNNLAGAMSVSHGRLVASAASHVNGASLVQAGTGQLTLNGNGVTYSNPLNISTTGYVASSGDSQNNADGAVRLNNGTLSGTITLSGNSRIGSFGSTTNTIGGHITGGFGIDFYGVEQGNAATVFVISNTANDYTGNTTIYNSLYNTTSTASVTSTTLRLGASNVIPNGASAGNVGFAVFSNGLNLPNATVVLDLAGFNETINGLTVNGGTFSTRITNSSTSNASNLQIGDNDTTSSFGGTIVDSGGSGTLSLTKIGSGTLTLNATNTYNGTTTVSGGTLALGAAGSIANSSLITIASGATLNVSALGGWSLGASQTLGGNGTIIGALTINGNLNPGNSPGILSFDDAATLAGTTTMEIDGANRGSEYDGVNTGSGLLTYGGNLTFDFGATFGPGSYSFDLFSLGSGNHTGNFSSVVLTGNYTGSLADLGNGTWQRVDSGNTWTFSQATGDLTFIAVPEPATIAILGAGVTLLGLRLARRRQASAGTSSTGPL